MEGVKMDVIKSGLYKGAGIAGTSLDDQQREMLQKEVEEIHADFKADVKAVREFADDSAMEGQTFSGKNAAAAGLVTGLVNGFDELMESLDAAVAEQMEADEKNDAAAAGGQPEESDEGANAKARRFASARALAGVDLKALSAAAKMAEGEKEDEDDKKEDAIVSDLDGTIKEDGEDAVNAHIVAHLKKMKAAGFKVHIVTGRLEDERKETEAFLARHKVESDGLHMKSSADDETPGYKVAAVAKLEEEGNKVSHILENDPACLEAYKAAGYNCIHPDTLSADEEKPESEDDEEGEDEGEEMDAKSEDDPDQDKAAPQPKSDEDEKKDDEDAKERAEDEEGDADDAVDTDEKPDKSGVKRNRSKGIA
jgi:hypothetical protein